MRILILTQYFPPETGAPQNRLSDLARRLTALGHDVAVLTALPNYPRGEIFPEYRGRWVVQEHFGAIHVVRTWIYACPKKSFIGRLLNYFSFVVSSVALGAWSIGSPEIILVESPPLFLGISGFLMSVWKNARMVLNVSDLWPESAVAMGIISNRWIIRGSVCLEEFLYRRSALITGQTQGIVDNIRLRFPGKPVALITNGVDVEAFLRAASANRGDAIRTEFDLRDKFVIGYAGLHGLAQGLDTLIRAARLVQPYEQVLFAFFGDGPEKPKVMELARELGLSNVRFFSSQPPARMPEIISTFDLAVVPLKKLDLFKGALPSKMFEAMAAGVPVVVTAEGEARELLRKAQAGISVEAENPDALAAAIIQLYNERERLRNFGISGQCYVLKHYDREQIARRLERFLRTGRDSDLAAV